MIQGVIIILALTLPVVAGLRAVLGKRVQALMLRASPQAGSAPPLSGQALEVAATTTPRVIPLDAEATPAKADEARHAETRQARSLFLRGCLYDAVGVTGVLAAWQLFFLSVGGQYDHMIEINWIGAAYLILIILRMVAYVGQYRDRAIRGAQPVGWFRRWITVAPEYLFRMFVHPQYSLYPLLFIVYAIYSSASTFYAWEFWAAATLLVPLMLRLHLARLARKHTNRRLLILRVFGRDKSSALTFGAIRRYWHHIGSTFTVVDRSYIRYKYRGHSESHLAIVIFSCVVWAAVFGTPEFHEWFFIGPVLSVIIILGYGVALGFMYVRAPRSFAASVPQIRDRLQHFLRRPRRWDLSYRDLDMYCFDNTWRDAVAAFVASADVVLMDLRGYSIENRGCETEVNFLFDSLTVDRIVFLVDSESDMDAIEDLLREAWKDLKAESPNLAVPDPAVKVYSIGQQTTQDVRGLANILVAAATSQGDAATR